MKSIDFIVGVALLTSCGSVNEDFVKQVEARCTGYKIRSNYEPFLTEYTAACDDFKSGKSYETAVETNLKLDQALFKAFFKIKEYLYEQEKKELKQEYCESSNSTNPDYCAYLEQEKFNQEKWGTRPINLELYRRKREQEKIELERKKAADKKETERSQNTDNQAEESSLPALPITPITPHPPTPPTPPPPKGGKYPICKDYIKDEKYIERCHPNTECSIDLQNVGSLTLTDILQDSVDSLKIKIICKKNWRKYCSENPNSNLKECQSQKNDYAQKCQDPPIAEERAIRYRSNVQTEFEKCTSLVAGQFYVIKDQACAPAQIDSSSHLSDFKLNVSTP